MRTRAMSVDVRDAFESASDYAVIGPTDNRVQQSATTHFPYRTICHLGRDFGDGRLRGCTGVLITPRLVLTAAHCLFNLLLRRAPNLIVVSPARRDRDTKPFGSIPASRAYVPGEFVEPTARRSVRIRSHDYGVIALPRPFLALNRFMPLVAPRDADLVEHRAITIAGYPGDRPVGTMWEHSESVARWTRRRLFYTVHTCPGHSGSPIWRESSAHGGPVIIGVHTSGIVDERARPYGCRKDTILAPPGTMNSGVRVTPELIKDVMSPEHRSRAERRMIQVYPTI